MADERTPLGVDDLYELGWIEDPRLSPDGHTVAYVHVTVDRVQNQYRRAIWIVPTSGGRPRRLTSGAKSDTTPRWSPDSRRLAFVSNREDPKGQVYLIALDGGEAVQVTRLPNGASAPAWSADGRRLAFLARVNESERAAEAEEPPPPADAWDLKRRKEQREYDEQQRVDPRVITRLPYRSNQAFFDDRRTHIYVMDVPETLDDPAGKPRRITDGDMHFGAPMWMPDGQSVLSTATRDPEADSLWSYYDVLRVPVDGGPPARLTEAGFSCFDPRPSPDGQLIAFLRRPEDRPLARGSRVALIAAQGGEPRDLTGHTDLNVTQYAWHPQGGAVLFSAEWHGDAGIHRITLDGHEQQPVSGPRIIQAFDVAPDGGIAFIAGSAENPCDLWYRRPDGSELQLTQINAALLGKRRLLPTEEIWFMAPDKAEVQGWVVRPPDYDPDAHYPLAVYIHGGPHTMWGPGFRTMWHEWQVAAARGYVVFFCNPRGSEGYGELWRDGIHAAWGEADMPDMMAGIDAVIARGGIDAGRIAVTGGSYGGYLTTWLISQSDRFCCAVSARGVYNLLTEHGTSDAHELIEFEFDGYPWDLQEELWRLSPVAHAHKITTPLRILHSEQDYRTPISEAEQLFAILRRRKQVVELVRYPREGHELTRTGEPRHRADHMERTLEWFDRYCRPEREEPV